MKIPKTIKIGWRTYTIQFTEERRNEKGDLLDGQIDFTNHVIYIYKNLPFEDEKIVAFLHEIIHGIFFSQGHSEWGDNEELVEAVSEGIFQVMSDNPNLFK